MPPQVCGGIACLYLRTQRLPVQDRQGTRNLFAEQAGFLNRKNNCDKEDLPLTKQRISPKAWVVLVGMVLIQAGMMGVLINCTGILFSAVLADCNFRAGDLSVYYTIRSLSSAAAVSFTSRLFYRRGGKIMAILGAVLAVSFGSMFFFDSLWQWYVSGVFAGVGMSCVMVIMPVVLNNWFKAHNGLVIGLAMSSSGIAGAVFSPICSTLVTSLGWRQAAIATACIGGALIILPSLFLISVSPDSSEDSPAGKKIETASAGNLPPVPAWIFPTCLVTLIGSGCLVQFNNQLPTFAMSAGYSLSVGATLTSLAMIGNVAGKLCLGALSDRIGIYRAVRVVLASVGVVMVLFLIGKQYTPVLYLGSLVYGTVYALATTMPSLVLLDLYGPTRYRNKVSLLQAISGLVFAFASSGFPYLYDLTGSFDIVFVLGACLCLLAFVLTLRLQHYSIHRNKSGTVSAAKAAS